MSPTAPESECPELVCGITSRLTDDLPDKSFLNPTVTITRLTVFSFRAAIHLNQLQILKANTNCLSRNLILIWCRYRYDTCISVIYSEEDQKCFKLFPEKLISVSSLATIFLCQICKSKIIIFTNIHTI